MAAKRPRIRRGNSARPLLAAARPTIGVDVNEPEIFRLQQLLADVGSAVGGVAGVERDRPVVVDETDEPCVLHACGLRAHRRIQNTLGKWAVVGEFDAVGPFGDGPDQRNRLGRMATRPSVGLKLVELLVEVGSGEPVAERIEDIIGGLAGTVQPAELTTHHRTVQQRRHDCSDAGERSRIVDRDVACPVDDAGPEPDGRTVPFPDAPHAHHKSQAARRGSRLVRVSHHAGVAERRTLDCVLVGEYRTQQQHSRLGKITGGIKAVGDFTGVPAEGADQIAVTPVEAGDDIVQRRAHLVLVEGQDASKHCTRAGVLTLETLLPGHEQPRDRPSTGRPRAAAGCALRVRPAPKSLRHSR